MTINIHDCSPNVHEWTDAWMRIRIYAPPKTTIIVPLVAYKPSIADENHTSKHHIVSKFTNIHWMTSKHLNSTTNIILVIFCGFPWENVVWTGCVKMSVNFSARSHKVRWLKADFLMCGDNRAENEDKSFALDRFRYKLTHFMHLWLDFLQYWILFWNQSEESRYHIVSIENTANRIYYCCLSRSPFVSVICNFIIVYWMIHVCTLNSLWIFQTSWAILAMRVFHYDFQLLFLNMIDAFVGVVFHPRPKHSHGMFSVNQSIRYHHLHMQSGQRLASRITYALRHDGWQNCRVPITKAFFVCFKNICQPSASV